MSTIRNWWLVSLFNFSFFALFHKLFVLLFLLYVGFPIFSLSPSSLFACLFSFTVKLLLWNHILRTLQRPIFIHTNESPSFIPFYFLLQSFFSLLTRFTVSRFFVFCLCHILLQKYYTWTHKAQRSKKHIASLVPSTLLTSWVWVLNLLGASTDDIIDDDDDDDCYKTMFFLIPTYKEKSWIEREEGWEKSWVCLCVS